MESKIAKKLKFRHDLAKLILDGTKTVTWRLFDDKDLQVGDQLTLVDSETGKEFAEGEIIRLREKKLSEVQEKDFEGHEKYESKKDMLKRYREYYGDKVTMSAMIKMIDFKLLRFRKRV